MNQEKSYTKNKPLLLLIKTISMHTLKLKSNRKEAWGLIMKILGKSMTKRSRLYLLLGSNNSILQNLTLIDLKDINKKMILSHILKETVDKGLEDQDHMEDLIHPCHKNFINKDPKVTILIGKHLEIRINLKDIIQEIKWESMGKIDKKQLKGKALLHLDGESKDVGEKINIRKIKSFVLLFSLLLLSLLFLDFV